jgi:hypothetical protein
MKTSMKLFLVHLGYYDKESFEGAYESHGNLFVIAESVEQARTKIKLHPTVSEKRMHIDGIQEIDAVEGFRVVLTEDPALCGATRVLSNRTRELETNRDRT